METTKNKIKIKVILIVTVVVGLLLALSVGITLGGFSLPAQVASAHGYHTYEGFHDATHERVFSINDDFADDTVIVVMTRQASLNLRTYTTFDFPELELREVRSLSNAVESNVRQQLFEAQNGFSAMQQSMSRDTYWDIEVDEFRQILNLTLENPGKKNVLQAIRMLEQRNDVYSAEPNVFISPGSLADMRAQASVTRIQLPQAWGISTGQATITVGIMDTGVDATRMEGRMLPANSPLHRCFTGSNISPLIDDGFPHAFNGHGTFVAGIIGCISAWNVRMASLRVFNTTTAGAGLNSVLDAIDHAILHNIPILNFSPNGYPHSDALQQRIRDFRGLFVMSAGNDNTHLTATANHIGRTPRNIVPNLVVVGASTATDGRATFSNWGATTVDVFAPGNSLLSKSPLSRAPSGFRTASGTSYAAPFVAGAAALMLSSNLDMIGGVGDTLGARLRTAILNNIDMPNVSGTNPLNGLSITNGRLNPLKATSSTMFTTGSATGGVSVNGVRRSLPSNANLTLPERFAPIGAALAINANAQQVVTAIGAGTFQNQTALSQTTIPPTVISVGIDAFNANTNVIWNYAFSVSNLSATTAEVIRPLRAFTSLSIPTILNGRTIVRIRTGAFIDQLQLTQASVPATVTNIYSRNGATITAL